jgi:DNA-binding MarR family transcriptional regulator
MAADDDEPCVTPLRDVLELARHVSCGRVESPSDVPVAKGVGSSLPCDTLRGSVPGRWLIWSCVSRNRRVADENDGQSRAGLFSKISSSSEGVEAALRAVDPDHDLRCHDHLPINAGWFATLNACILQLDSCIIQWMAGNAIVEDSGDIRGTVEAANPIAVVETEMALLQRALERLARRSDIHRDLDRASYLVARTLEATGPISLKELARRLGVDATTVTRQVATMEDGGLVSRCAEPTDGRVCVIALAPAGRRKMRAEQAMRRKRVQELVAGWSGKDQVALGRLLGRLNDAICELEHAG